MEKNCNRTLYSRIQRVMNIKITKAYSTTSNDAVYILTGNAPVELKTEEAANLYRITNDRQKHLLDHETEHQDWNHPADTVRITEQNETMEHTIHIYTDGSKTEQAVGSGIAIYVNNKLTHQIKHKLNNRCSNNQAEQTAILKALHALETIKLDNNTSRTVKLFTDSKITTFSLKNAKNRKHLIEEIRRKTNDLENENWHIDFTWIKVHAGNSGNDLADKLAKEAI